VIGTSVSHFQRLPRFPIDCTVQSDGLADHDAPHHNPVQRGLLPSFNSRCFSSHHTPYSTEYRYLCFFTAPLEYMFSIRLQQLVRGGYAEGVIPCWKGYTNCNYVLAKRTAAEYAQASMKLSERSCLALAEGLASIQGQA
jgi:hypothetical protein